MPGLEGKTLDHYELRRVIGRGGMADVYAGYDPLYEREVAVKVFKREEEQMLRRFIREAQLMDSLDNTHLVPIYDSGSSLIGDITWYYIVMPFMQGGTLRARIRRSPLSLTETCIDLGDIADALDYIHSRDIVHRDIKSSNVLLDAEGRCYLADFGIARINTDATQLTSTGNVLGTVDYVAPELFETNRKADAGTDLYSLGVLLFEMVTGQLPFTAENQIALVTMHMNAQPPAPSSIAPHIPPAVDRVILRALAKKPEQRYRSATELADAFCHAVAFGVADPAASEQVVDAMFGVVPPVDAYQGGQAPVASDLPTLIQSPAGQSARSGPVILPPPVTGQPRRGMQTPAFPLQGTPIPPISPIPPVSPPRPSGPIRPQRRRDRRGLIIAILALVALLLVLVPIIVVAITHSGNTIPPGANGSTSTVALTQTAATGSTATPTTVATPTPSPTPNVTATAQAQAAATATADAQATASAIAAVTATARAQASATAGVIATATGGTPSYADALNNPNATKTQAAQWDGLNGSDSQCVFASDGYHVKQNVSSNNLHACHEAANQYGNATIKVDVTILKGHSGGLFLRFSSGLVGNYNGYLFEIDSKGTYKLSSFAGNTIQNWTPSSALKTGYNVTNTLAVIMNGNSFALYANGSYLTTLTDSANQFTSGNAAFFASAANADTEVVFSNLGVYPSS